MVSLKWQWNVFKSTSFKILDPCLKIVLKASNEFWRQNTKPLFSETDRNFDKHAKKFQKSKSVWEGLGPFFPHRTVFQFGKEGLLGKNILTFQTNRVLFGSSEHTVKVIFPCQRKISAVASFDRHNANFGGLNSRWHHVLNEMLWFIIKTSFNAFNVK